ncbi:amidase signature enzyme [Xylariaceae sp. FL0255]|nr:amidase signature enzyme [Xylariaceae sp. FL0255]
MSPPSIPTHVLRLRLPSQSLQEGSLVIECDSIPYLAVGAIPDCDVYTRKHFLMGLIITNLDIGETLDTEFRDYLGKFGNTWVELRYEKHVEDQLLPGPYLYRRSELRPICRLYDDKQRAFLTTFRPKFGKLEDTTFSQLSIAGTLYDHLAVAVPVRSAENLSSAQRRLRIAVKDLYQVQGMKTSLNNIAYYDYSDEATSSAAVVESLVRDGAHILGLTKLSSMIAREEPMDAIDFSTAFNPRGDGYQSPAGSSSGSAAAVASYPWLDCALGSDTSGSGRRPAMMNGVWQFRPSHDLVSCDGMVTTYPRFDTPCVLSRELDHLGRVLQSWIPAAEQSSHIGRSSYEIMELIGDFIKDMLKHLSATLTRLSIRKTWSSTHPLGLPERVDEYLKDVITKTYYYAFYHLTDTFRKVYASSHNGKTPYVIPFVRRRWEKGAAVTATQHADATKKLDIYREWLMNTLFPSLKRLVVLPVAEVAPNYRDVVSPSPDEQCVLDELFLAPVLGSPDIVVPIGDIPYKSRVTQKTEYLPVVINVVGAPGADFQLLEAVNHVMKLSGRPISVSTGSRMFTQSRSEL